MTTHPPGRPKVRDAMKPSQALNLAILVLEWESEMAYKNRSVAWGKECIEAAAVLRRLAQNTGPGIGGLLPEHPAPIGAEAG